MVLINNHKFSSKIFNQRDFIGFGFLLEKNPRYFYKHVKWSIRIEFFYIIFFFKSYYERPLKYTTI